MPKRSRAGDNPSLHDSPFAAVRRAIHSTSLGRPQESAGSAPRSAHAALLLPAVAVEMPLEGRFGPLTLALGQISDLASQVAQRREPVRHRIGGSPRRITRCEQLAASHARNLKCHRAFVAKLVVHFVAITGLSGNAVASKLEFAAQ